MPRRSILPPAFARVALQLHLVHRLHLSSIPPTLKYGTGQSAAQFETWNKTKAERMEKQGMKTMTVYLSLLKNEVVDGQLQSLANLNGGMKKCGQCGRPHAKVGGECGMATFVGGAP